MIKRCGETVVFGQRYTLRPGAYALPVLGDQVLLTFQSEPKPELQLPGGGIDPGEGCLRALHREVFEETGWRFTAPRRLGAFRRFCYMPDYSLWAEKLCHVYLVRPTVCLGAPSEPHHTAIWVPAREAADMLAPEVDGGFARLALDF